jgi:hypothetical protein
MIKLILSMVQHLQINKHNTAYPTIELQNNLAKLPSCQEQRNHSLDQWENVPPLVIWILLTNCNVTIHLRNMGWFATE